MTRPLTLQPLSPTESTHVWLRGSFQDPHFLNLRANWAGALHFPAEPPALHSASPTRPPSPSAACFLGQRVEGDGQATRPDLGSAEAGNPTEWGVKTWWVRGLAEGKGWAREGLSLETRLPGTGL